MTRQVMRVHLTLVLAAAVLLLATTAQAQAWRPTARQCAEEIDAKAGCGSCGGLWPAWSRCTVERFYHGRIPQARVEQAIREVQAIRDREHACNACGDPVADVLRRLEQP